MGLGPSQGYNVIYNGYTAPGYCQQESFDSTANVVDHYAPYADGSNSEYTGLANKVLSLRMKVWEQGYLAAKNEIQKAATIFRSKKWDYAPLYVQYSDRHYDAKTQSIRLAKQAGGSVNIAEYELQFECKPWLVSDTTSNASGTGLVTVTRTLDDGGWTPTRITVTGTNVTISGYLDNGDPTGFVSVSGAVSGLLIDSDAFTATIGGNNANGQMYWVDYRTYVGPGTTHFQVTGASSCAFEWENRWYI